jgi:hypothetical protein
MQLCGLCQSPFTFAKLRHHSTILCHIGVFPHPWKTTATSNASARVSQALILMLHHSNSCYSIIHYLAPTLCVSAINSACTMCCTPPWSSCCACAASGVIMTPACPYFPHALLFHSSIIYTIPACVQLSLFCACLHNRATAAPYPLLYSS